MSSFNYFYVIEYWKWLSCELVGANVGKEFLSEMIEFKFYYLAYELE